MYTLPSLPYAYEALEPVISADIMHLHHEKHHATYVEQLNNALQPYPELQNRSLEDIVSHIDDLPEDIRTRVTNHGGGHHNHTLFWESLTPHPSPLPTELENAIIAAFASLQEYESAFKKSALSVFGSGWTWLVLDGHKLLISNTPNQNSPLMSGHIPLVGIDVWEHAYYLQYQNRRAEYLDEIWKIINWNVVHERYQKALSSK